MSSSQTDAIESLIKDRVVEAAEVVISDGIAKGIVQRRGEFLWGPEQELELVRARIGKLKGGQERKVSTDALKLLGLREFYPEARLVLAFIDQEAADSIVGWKAALLQRQGIERRIVEIDPKYRALISETQVKQDLSTADR